MSKLTNGSFMSLEKMGKNTDGKKFTTWEIHNPLAKESIPVVVTFHNKMDSLYFIAHIEKFKINIKNSDIEQLKKDTQEYITKQVNQQKNLVWEDWLSIKISKHSKSDNNEKTLDLTVSITNIQKGIDLNQPEKEYTFTRNNTLMPFPNSGKFDLDEDSYIKTTDPKGEEIKFIVNDTPHSVIFMKDTPENRNALDNFLKEMDHFTDRLRDFILNKDFKEKINSSIKLINN